MAFLANPAFLQAITAIGTLVSGGAAIAAVAKKGPKAPVIPKPPRAVLKRSDSTARQKRLLARRPGGAGGLRIGALGGGAGAVRPTLSG